MVIAANTDNAKIAAINEGERFWSSPTTSNVDRGDTTQRCHRRFTDTRFWEFEWDNEKGAVNRLRPEETS
jgi:hypothetical protein